MARTRKKGEVQGTFGFMRHGGARKGAGRKPEGKRRRVSHAKREKITPHTPVHVTTRLVEGLPSLRRAEMYTEVLEAMVAGAVKPGFRVLHYSIQSNHIHLIAEGDDTKSFWKGMQGLKVRIARAVNRVLGRKGTVFADRYHPSVLKSPREVRAALAYVLKNAQKHGITLGKRVLDPFSSSHWFEGWKEKVISRFPSMPNPLPNARSWLMRIGWRKYGGPLSIESRPVGAS